MTHWILAPSMSAALAAAANYETTEPEHLILASRPHHLVGAELPDTIVLVAGWVTSPWQGQNYLHHLDAAAGRSGQDHGAVVVIGTEWAEPVLAVLGDYAATPVPETPVHQLPELLAAAPDRTTPDPETPADALAALADTTEAYKHDLTAHANDIAGEFGRLAGNTIRPLMDLASRILAVHEQQPAPELTPAEQELVDAFGIFDQEQTEGGTK